MLTALHFIARTLVWSLVGLGLALVLVMVRLDAGPLTLDWLKPRIERALAPDDGKISVSAESIELRLNKEERTFDLVGVDVRYRAVDTDGASSLPFLAFPEVEVALSVEALLKRGMIAASEVQARRPPWSSRAAKRALSGSTRRPISTISPKTSTSAVFFERSRPLRKRMTASPF